ncbi:hypothetical protein G3M55_93430 [Streptomyces sp. SID8455]|nr:hypothetical protein [Streptomyces sp. SID8455]
MDVGPVRAISQASNQLAGIDWGRTRFHDHDGSLSGLKGRLQEGDVLVNSTGTGTLGRVGYFSTAPDGTPCMADSHVTLARVEPGLLDSRFLYYWLGSSAFQHYLKIALAVGATNQIELNRDRLGDAPVPLPPFDEQRRIADFLELETGRMEMLGKKLAKFRSDLSERDLALLGGLLNCHVEHSGSPLPEGWLWTPLGHLTDPFRQIMYGIVLPGPNVPEGVPVVKGGDVVADRLSLASLNRTTREIESRYERSRLEGGDLVIAIRGSVGEVATVPEELTGANLTQDAARISIGDSIDARWLRFVLRSPFVMHEIQRRVTGATIKGINIWDLKRVPIPVPPLQAQSDLAVEVSHEIALHDSLREGVSRHELLLAERRQALITAAVTGQFDVSTASGRNVTDVTDGVTRV